MSFYSTHNRGRGKRDASLAHLYVSEYDKLVWSSKSALQILIQNRYPLGHYVHGLFSFCAKVKNYLMVAPWPGGGLKYERTVIASIAQCQELYIGMLSGACKWTLVNALRMF